MQEKAALSFYWSKAFLQNRWFLWLLFLCNLAGTFYGYVWYWQQMVDTVADEPNWYVLFVPDSPTASLFFTGSVLYLLMDRARNRSSQPSRLAQGFRGFVEAFALITSFKYGIWAVTMIWSGAWQGVPVAWDGWMLTVSHLAMAVEALLYARWYTYRIPAILLVALWTFWNDFMDYERGVFPRLPRELWDNLQTIQCFTIGLSILGIGIALLFLFSRRRA